MKIAVDGHSSCGKSTLAKAVAQKFGFIYIDSGAMYRAVSLYALENKLLGNIGELENALSSGKIKIDFKSDKISGKDLTFLNEKLVEKEIRSLVVAQIVSEIAAIPFVRKEMVGLQRKLSENKSVVMDGRDIGTVVFPDAELKVFLTADAEIRAKRRYEELKNKGENSDYKAVLENLKKRDKIDTTRKTDPLRKADGAVLIDNSFLSIEQQNDKVFKLVNAVLFNVIEKKV